MKRILTKTPVASIAKDLGTDYFFLRRCLLFERNGMVASKLRAKVLKNYKCVIVNV